MDLKIDDVVFTGSEARQAINETLELAFDYAQIDGAHHKAWVIDQMVRKLTGSMYDKFIEEYHGEPDDEGEMEYEWDEGIAP